jgi:hypothetical protein
MIEGLDTLKWHIQRLLDQSDASSDARAEVSDAFDAIQAKLDAIDRRIDAIGRSLRALADRDE